MFIAILAQVAQHTFGSLSLPPTRYPDAKADGWVAEEQVHLVVVIGDCRRCPARRYIRSFGVHCHIAFGLPSVTQQIILLSHMTLDCCAVGARLTRWWLLDGGRSAFKESWTPPA